MDLQQTGYARKNKNKERIKPRKLLYLLRKKNTRFNENILSSLVFLLLFKKLTIFLFILSSKIPLKSESFESFPKKRALFFEEPFWLSKYFIFKVICIKYSIGCMYINIIEWNFNGKVNF